MAARHIIADLSQRIRALERTQRSSVPTAEYTTTGVGSKAQGTIQSLPSFERWLGEAGWPRGCLVEWLAEGCGSGAASLALWASQAAWRNKLLILIDSQREFHAPAAIPFAVDLRRTVFIRPAQSSEALWSLEQALRTRGIGAVICDVEQLSPQQSRRLQLAAETGGGLGILLRPGSARGQPSFAEYRLGVQPLPLPHATSTSAGVSRRWRVELLRARQRFGGDAVIVELSDGPRGLCLAAKLASATPAA